MVVSTNPANHPLPLSLVVRLAEQLERAGVHYCHWKSNHRLSEFLAGSGDLDLLVAPEDARRFNAVVAQLGFLSARPPEHQRQRSVEHYYGLDSGGHVVHLHVYYRLVTGGLILKDYELPFAEELLASAHAAHFLRRPSVPAECLVFLIRKLLEAASRTERLLLQRHATEVLEEWHWLRHGGDSQFGPEEMPGQLEGLWKRRFPESDVRWIREGIEALDRADWRFASRMGRQLRRTLTEYRIHAPRVAVQLRATRFARRVLGRLHRHRRGKQLASGGAVVALVGCDGSGKSSTLAGIAAELALHLDTRTLHLGRPASARPWIALARLFRPRSCSNPSTALRPASLWRQAARVYLAWQRLRSARLAARWARSGALVLCDRYPSRSPGMDGPLPQDRRNPTTLARFLARWETRLYQRIPPTDCVVELQVPFQILQARLESRGECVDAEAKRLLWRRLMQIARQEIPGDRRFPVDASGEPAECQAKVMTQIWHYLVYRERDLAEKVDFGGRLSGAAVA